MDITTKGDIFFIDGTQQHESDSERDLGVIFCTDLKLKNQVLTATNKANQMLDRIKKSFARFDSNLMRAFYSTNIKTTARVCSSCLVTLKVILI